MSQSTKNQTSTDPVSGNDARPFSLETFVVHSYVEDAIQEPPSESAIVADCDNVDLVQRSQQLNDGVGSSIQQEPLCTIEVDEF